MMKHLDLEQNHAYFWLVVDRGTVLMWLLCRHGLNNDHCSHSMFYDVSMLQVVMSYHAVYHKC